MAKREVRDPTIVCSFCGTKQVPLLVGEHFHDHPRYAGHDVVERLVICRSCDEPMVVRQSCLLEQDVLDMYPTTTPRTERLPGVPKRVEDDYNQAVTDAWFGSYRSAVAMARRAMQAIALDKGAPVKDRLVDQIDALKDAGVVTANLQKAAHMVRALGNDGAHPDKDGLDQIEKQDATESIDFLKSVLDHVYVLPHRIAEQEKRLAGRGRTRA